MNFMKYHVSKNLFDKDSMVVDYYLSTNGAYTPTGANSRSILFKCEPYTKYTFKGLLHKTFRIATYTYLPTGGTTSYVNFYNRDSSEAVTTNTITTVSGENYVVIFCYNNTTEAGWYSINEYFSNVMLNVGDEPLPYEPYGNTWLDSHYIKGTDTDTITTLPATIYPLAQTATVGLKGNEQHTGTPSPDNPVMPQGTGERTANLCATENFANSTTDTRSFLQLAIMCYYGSDFVGRATFSGGTQLLDIKTTGNKQILFTVTAENCNRLFIKHNGATRDISISNVYGAFSGDYNISFDCNGTNPTVVDGISLANIMLNAGSTALPYEPYGYKIPILSASTTTPVYLGEVETTRKIKKLVLTGEETWYIYNVTHPTGYDIHQFYTQNIGINSIQYSSCYSNITPYGMTSDTRHTGEYGCYTVSLGKEIAFQMIGVTDTIPDVPTWKQYLAQQYAAGTPVTVWYVLANEETAVVNEPLMKIGEYADTLSNVSIPVTAGGDTLSVGTTVQPSEVTVNYKGWHPVADVRERNNGAWT